MVDGPSVLEDPMPDPTAVSAASTTPTEGLLAALVSNAAPPPFAVLHREGGRGVEVLVGDVVDVAALADIPLPSPGSGVTGPQVLALVPYRQVVERGFACHDDGFPLRCLVVREWEVLDLERALDLLPAQDPEVTAGGFDVDDVGYAATVARVVAQEIGRGEGANFVKGGFHLGAVGWWCASGGGDRLPELVRRAARLVRPGLEVPGLPGLASLA